MGPQCHKTRYGLCNDLTCMFGARRRRLFRSFSSFNYNSNGRRRPLGCKYPTNESTLLLTICAGSEASWPDALAVPPRAAGRLQPPPCYRPTPQRLSHRHRCIHLVLPCCLWTRGREPRIASALFPLCEAHEHALPAPICFRRAPAAERQTGQAHRQRGALAHAGNEEDNRSIWVRVAHCES